MGCCGSGIKGRLAALLALGLALPGFGHAQATSYLDHEGLTRELRSIVNSSSLASMESLGKTLEGRDVWMIQVGSPGGLPLEERPGILVVANLEGDHLVGSHLALEAVRYLVSSAQDEAVASALRDRVFYVFPRLNPDGAEAMFARVKSARKTNARPYDEDNDGRTDEDGPEDLNGDGYITVMRVPDPAGAFMVDPANPRLMKRADPTKGERGGYAIHWEGTDTDGDGFINEDGPGGVDLNRNFQHAYPYWEGDAGPYMLSEIESRALMDFALAHRNIAAILTFGETDNLVTPPNARGELAAAKGLCLPVFAEASNAEVFQVGVFGAGGAAGRGFAGFGGGGGRGGGAGGVYIRGALPGADNDPSSGTRPATTVNSGDLAYYETVSEIYRRITGIETVPVHRTPEGAFFQFGYFQYGVPSFSTPGWGMAGGGAPDEARGRPTAEAPAEAAATAGGGRMGARPTGGASLAGGAPQAAGAQGSSGSDAEILKALEAAGIQPFADWSPFQHPELGQVEIGGFLPYATVNPPVERTVELGPKHGEFLVELAGKLARARIADTEVISHGGGVFTVTVDVENSGFFPTSLRHGQTSRSVGPTFVQIQVDSDDILSGADKTTSVGILNGSGGRETVTWVIQGRQGAQVEIRLRSQKSGQDTATVTLR